MGIAELIARMRELYQRAEAQLAHVDPLTRSRQAWEAVAAGLDDTAALLRQKSGEIEPMWPDDAGRLYAERLARSAATVQGWERTLAAADLPAVVTDLAAAVRVTVDAVREQRDQFNAVIARLATVDGAAAGAAVAVEALVAELARIVAGTDGLLRQLDDSFAAAAGRVTGAADGTAWDGPAGGRAGTGGTGGAAEGAAAGAGEGAAGGGGSGAGGGGAPPPAGAAGRTGPAAPSPAGAASPAGSPSPVGAAGSSSPIGLSGSPSPAGLSGSPSPAGLGGLPGPIGSAGVSSPVAASPIGLAGSLGLPGSLGLTGPSALPGAASIGPLPPLGGGHLPLGLLPGAGSAGGGSRAPIGGPVPAAGGAIPRAGRAVSGAPLSAAQPPASPAVQPGGTAGTASRTGRMFPPLLGGAAHGPGSRAGAGEPQPGDQPSAHRDRPLRSLPGVPPALRGRTGPLKATPAFLAGDRASNPPAESVLDEDLWYADRPAAPLDRRPR